MKEKILVLTISSMLLVGLSTGASRWKEILIPQISQGYVFVDFSDSLDGLIFSKEGVFARTTDGGTTWKTGLVDIVGKISQIKYFGKGSCWIQVDSSKNNTSLYYASNSEDWIRCRLPDSVRYLNPASGFATAKKIFATGGSGLMSSEDGGKTWEVSYKATGQRSSISFADSMVGVVSFSNNDGTENYGCLSLRTTNAGATWNANETGQTAYEEVHFYTSTRGFIRWLTLAIDGMYFSSGMMLTTDGGKTYEVIDMAGAGVYSKWIYPLCGIKFAPSLNLLLGTDSQMKQGLDGSFTTTRGDSAAIPIVAFESVSDDINWILASGNRLFQSIGMPTNVGFGADNNLLAEFVLHQNYPNPFNPSTSIAFDLPRPSQISLRVYDCLGREVAMVAEGYRSAGSYEEHFSAKGLSSGVYFCRLVANKNVLTKVMLLLK